MKAINKIIGTAMEAVTGAGGSLAKWSFAAGRFVAGLLPEFMREWRQPRKVKYYGKDKGVDDDLGDQLDEQLDRMRRSGKRSTRKAPRGPDAGN